METDLKPFESRDVVETSIRVTNAGDGLSKALKIDPAEFRIGERVYVVLECDVAKVRHEPVKPEKGEELDLEGNLQRVHFLSAGAATIVAKDLVLEHINAQKDRIQQAADEAAGQARLDLEAEEKALDEQEQADDAFAARRDAIKGDA